MKEEVEAITNRRIILLLRERCVPICLQPLFCTGKHTLGFVVVSFQGHPFETPWVHLSVGFRWLSIGPYSFFLWYFLHQWLIGIFTSDSLFPLRWVFLIWLHFTFVNPFYILPIPLPAETLQIYGRLLLQIVGTLMLWKWGCTELKVIQWLEGKALKCK